MTSAASLPTESIMAEKKPLKQWIKIAVGLGLIAFLLHQTGLENTFSALAQANLWYIPVGIVIYLMAQLISTYRWKFLAEAIGFHRSLRELYDYYLIGMFSNQFLPGAIGGDAVRMYYLAKSCSRKKREALLTLIAERGVGLVALLLLTAAVCLLPQIAQLNWNIPVHIPGLPTFHWNVRYMVLILSSLIGIGYVGLWLFPIQKWVERFPKLELISQARVYWANIPLLAKSVGLSLFVHALMVAVHGMIANAMHIDVPLLYLAVIYGVVSLVSVLPITQGGLGVRELAYQSLLVKLGVDSHTALAFGVYWFLISTLTSLFGGLILMKGHYKTPNADEVELSEV
jgi:glycosyltransferase 2 family protein